MAMAEAAPNVQEGFVFHSGQLWLPPDFWKNSPEGGALTQLDWIQELRPLQHGDDTTPGDAGKNGTIREEEPDSNQTPQSVEPAPILSPIAKTEKSEPPPDTPATVKKGKLFFDWKCHFAPLMVGLFLLCLALSWMVLLYHRNHPKNVISPAPEVTNEER